MKEAHIVHDPEAVVVLAQEADWGLLKCNKERDFPSFAGGDRLEEGISPT